MSEKDLSELLAPAGAARLMGITPSRVRQLCDEGRLPVTRTQLGRLIRTSDVLALSDERRAKKAARRGA